MMGNSVGYWDSCSGCTDSVDGYISHRLFPIHPKHHVHVGSGCDECKGKGIVFHPFTKADAEAWEEYGSTASKAEGA